MFLQTMPGEKVKKIVVTGTIGSGKSFVCDLLKKKGIPVLDLDVVAAKVREHEDVKKEIIDYFGEEILDEKKEISNELLSKIVFHSHEKRKKLESIIHRRVYDEMLFFFESNFYQKIIVVEMAMLFEFGWENYFDSIWLVTSEKDIAIARLIKYRGYTKAKAESILRVQMNNIDKINRSNYVIINNEGSAQLEEQLQDILDKEM